MQFYTTWIYSKNFVISNSQTQGPLKMADSDCDEYAETHFSKVRWQKNLYILLYRYQNTTIYAFLVM